MMWKAWKETGLMENELLNETNTIAATVFMPGTEQIPHWKTDDSITGFARDNANGVGVSTPKEIFGHQRPT
jgi:hypothetical protein